MGFMMSWKVSLEPEPTSMETFLFSSACQGLQTPERLSSLGLTWKCTTSAFCSAICFTMKERTPCSVLHRIWHGLWTGPYQMCYLGTLIQICHTFRAQARRVKDTEKECTRAPLSCECLLIICLRQSHCSVGLALCVVQVSLCSSCLCLWNAGLQSCTPAQCFLSVLLLCCLVLGIEPRTLYMVFKCSNTEPDSKLLFWYLKGLF